MCIFVIIYMYIYPIGIVYRVFANGPGKWFNPRSKNIQLDASLLNTQHYKAGMKGKWSIQEMSRTVPSISL